MKMIYLKKIIFDFFVVCGNRSGGIKQGNVNVIIYKFRGFL